MKQAYFPMFVDISRKRILIVGGGKIAARRAAVISQFASDIVMIAPDFCEQSKMLESGHAVRLICRSYEESDLEQADIVITATDNHELNAAIGRCCKEKKILVNVADDQSLCDFYFPGIVIEEDIVIGISSGGKEPSKVKKVREIFVKAFHKGAIPGA